MLTQPEINTLPISAPRYSARPFPPYRFVPARHPHPNSPQGHSFRPPGEPEPQVTFHPPERWRQSEDYLFGCDLYNHGFWWEAHEAWEGLWKLTPKAAAQRSFLQGLIQVSARHLQLFLGNLHGVERLGETGLQHLAAARATLDGPKFMGLDLDGFVTQVRAYFGDDDKVSRDKMPRHDAAGLRDNPPGHKRLRHDADRFPYLRLDFEADDSTPDS